MVDDEPPDDENPAQPWSKHDRASNVREALFVSDAEIYRRLGVGPRTGRTAILLMERGGRFPKKDPVFGNKRYWPAVAKAIDIQRPRTPQEFITQSPTALRQRRSGGPSWEPKRPGKIEPAVATRMETATSEKS
jgi:hypothetical protein